MTKYPYENLNDTEFEHLVIKICKEVLGIACKTFSEGKDGGKDSWFEGRADAFPSKSQQWNGKFIIQAKHTKTLNASCSDNDFSVNQTSILSKEINRLIEVKTVTPFNNYIIFTNRKLSGGSHSEIVKMFREKLKMQNVEIIGREDIDSYLTDYPHIANQFGLYKFAAPLRFYEKDIKKVIIVFSEQSKGIANQAESYITSFDLINKIEKNELNNLSSDYFEFLKSHSLQYFEEIETFLKNPINEEYTRMYANTISDLQAKISLERNRFTEFEFLIEHLVDFIVENNADGLRDLRKVVRVFIHFMYFNCDIGKTS